MTSIYATKRLKKKERRNPKLICKCPNCIYKIPKECFEKGCKCCIRDEGWACIHEHDRSKWPQVPYSKICMCPHCSHSTRDKCVEYNCQCCAERDARIMGREK